MKNIHVLLTDKPSRLWVNNLRRRLELDKDVLIGSNTAQHIYITNDEEIKKGDWSLHKDGKGIICEVNLIFENGDLLLNNATRIKPLEFKKIILTTDQDLIKDGVQAIDNEFLEWFVKNPSCEEVEVGYGWIRLTETDNEGYWVSIPNKQFEMQQEEPKDVVLGYKTSLDAQMLDKIEPKQERMYSEEEVEMIARDAYEMGRKNILIGVFNKWFEQFKKK
jgi:hypothetical protein